MNDAAKVKRVKEVYKDLDLEGIYQKYEEDSFAPMQSMIKTGASRRTKPIYTWLLSRIYKRTK